jgi:hypothetical protein
VIVLPMLAAGAVVDTPRLQRQLDFMVGICRANEIVRFVAHEGNVVTMELRKPGLPSVSENKALQCALAKLKERDDLRLEAAGPKGDAQ